MHRNCKYDISVNILTNCERVLHVLSLSSQLEIGGFMNEIIQPRTLDECVVRLTAILENHEKRLDRHENDISGLKSAPVKNWQTVISSLITALITAVITSIITKGAI